MAVIYGGSDGGVAAKRRVLANGCHALGQCKFVQSGTIVEAVASQRSNGSSQIDITQIGALSERQITHVGHPCRYINGVVGIFVNVPRCQIHLIVIISHRSVAADGEDAVAAEQPRDVRRAIGSAFARSHNLRSRRAACSAEDGYLVEVDVRAGIG